MQADCRATALWSVRLAFRNRNETRTHATASGGSRCAHDRAHRQWRRHARARQPTGGHAGRRCGGAAGGLRAHRPHQGRRRPGRGSGLPRGGPCAVPPGGLADRRLRRHGDGQGLPRHAERRRPDGRLRGDAGMAGRRGDPRRAGRGRRLLHGRQRDVRLRRPLPVAGGGHVLRQRDRDGTVRDAFDAGARADASYAVARLVRRPRPGHPERAGGGAAVRVVGGARAHARSCATPTPGTASTATPALRRSTSRRRPTAGPVPSPSSPVDSARRSDRRRFPQSTARCDQPRVAGGYLRCRSVPCGLPVKERPGADEGGTTT